MKTRLLALIMCTLMLFSLASCSANGKETPDTTDANKQSSTENQLPKIWDDALYTENKEFGKGKNTVQVEIRADNKSVVFTINTDAEMLGDALIEHKLIEGEEGPYGIYIKKANGIEADFDKDQSYWSLSMDGEYLMSGVDTTPISDGEHYELTYTK